MQERPTAKLDPINRLADVLTSMQNRPRVQQLSIRQVNANTMTFDSKSELFELLEDLIHTMIKMQPEMSEQTKINHFHSLLRKGALQTSETSVQPINILLKMHWSFSDVNMSNLSQPNTMQVSYILEHSIKGQRRRLEITLRK